jgi:hypothetical protein
LVLQETNVKKTPQHPAATGMFTKNDLNSGRWDKSGGRGGRMRQVRCPIFTLASALSLLLCLATAVLWVRSYSICDLFLWHGYNRSAFMETGGGQFRVEYTRMVGDDSWRSHGGGFEHRTDKADGRLQDGMRMPGEWQYLKGYDFWLVTGERWWDYHYAIFAPAWFFTGALILLPAIRFQRLPRKRPPAVGLCPTCRYNLTGNTSGVCPECGTPVAKKVEAKA